MAVTIVTQDNYTQEVSQAETAVLIDFWAPWCGPCRMLSPVVDEIAEESDGQFKVCKVNVDDEPELAQQFGVMSIPTLVVIRNNETVAKSVGVQAKQDILNMLKQ